MNNKPVTIIILTLILLVLTTTTVSATGTCSLGKFQYHPPESAAFACSCTSAAEENRAGNFLFLNSTGGVLQNTTTNSGSCRTSFFATSFSFPTGANYTGNATFVTTNAAWNNGDDVVSDNFNVSQAQTNDCTIENIDVHGATPLGDLAAVHMDIIDGITTNPLVQMSCILEIKNAARGTILIEPYGPGDAGRFSTAGGHVTFEHTLNEPVWTTSTEYEYEIHCHCIPGSVIGAECIDDTTGLPTVYKSCSADGFFNTSSIDNRISDAETNGGLALTLFMLAIVLGLVVINLTVPFSKGELLNLILKRTLWLFILALMWLNTAIMFTLTELAGLNLEKEMTRYIWLFGAAIVMAMFFIAFKTLTDFLEILDQRKFKKRMGESRRGDE